MVICESLSHTWHQSCDSAVGSWMCRQPASVAQRLGLSVANDILLMCTEVWTVSSHGW